jgi:rhamnosyltransferase
VEDRDWAKKVLGRGYKIIYEPSASVYHHHGIHQGRNVERAERVVRVIEMINNGGRKE